MECQGVPIQEAHLKHSVPTGITYEVMVPGVVPFYEECEAAQWGHFNMRAWTDLEVEEKALIVAQKRLARQIELHAEDAVARAAEKKMEKEHGRHRR